MDKQTALRLIAWLPALGLGLLTASCGEDKGGSPSPSAAPVTTVGDINLACSLGGTSAQGSKAGQIQFQQQVCPAGGSSVPGPRQFQIVELLRNHAGAFDLDFDCQHREVRVRSKEYTAEQTRFPLQADGSFQGTLRILKQVQNDGKGTSLCWLGFIVTFKGHGSCDTNQPGSSASGETSLPPASTVSVQAGIDFRQVTWDELKKAGITGEAPGSNTGTGINTGTGTGTGTGTSTDTGTSTSTSTSTGTGTGTGTGTQTPPSPLPSASLTPVRICLIQNACSIQGAAELTCPTP